MCRRLLSLYSKCYVGKGFEGGIVVVDLAVKLLVFLVWVVVTVVEIRFCACSVGPLMW